MRRPRPGGLALVLFLSVLGCPSMRGGVPERPTPTAATEWPSAHAMAMTEARESRLPNADRVLTEFARRFAESPEAAEVPYWRAVLKLDPGNPPSVREAVVLLEGYLANATAGLHRTEATTLHRLGVALEQRNAALAAIPSTPVVRPEDKAREEELQRLRDELGKANAELARIRRRLARPRP